MRRLEIAKEDFEQWFESAASFLITYDSVFKRKDYKQAAFLLHQATERFYKAAILTHSGYSPKGHNLSTLGNIIARDYPEFKKIFPQKTEQEKHFFKQLKKAYIDARYKKDYCITREELEYLIKRAEKLRDLVEKTCEGIIKSLKSEIK